ncbi:dUTP diphosphatase [Corynebacterium marquesiae]|uniref:dUTP diphosphatase n=1 Tax=Corynebacterium marquesiae TaxID=2913503 RepID=UPI0038D1D044
MKFKVGPTGYLPIRAHDTDAGLDLFTPKAVSLPAGAIVKVELGIAAQFPPATYGKIEGRSSLAARGVDILGGVVDQGYRGEIAVVLKNNSDFRLEFNRGDRIAQLIVQPYVAEMSERANELDDTERGAGGFGSTGN